MKIFSIPLQLVQLDSLVKPRQNAAKKSDLMRCFKAGKSAALRGVSRYAGGHYADPSKVDAWQRGWDAGNKAK